MGCLSAACQLLEHLPDRREVDEKSAPVFGLIPCYIVFFLTEQNYKARTCVLIRLFLHYAVTCARSYRKAGKAPYSHGGSCGLT